MSLRNPFFDLQDDHAHARREAEDSHGIQGAEEIEQQDSQGFTRKVSIIRRTWQVILYPHYIFVHIHICLLLYGLSVIHTSQF